MVTIREILDLVVLNKESEFVEVISKIPNVMLLNVYDEVSDRNDYTFTHYVTREILLRICVVTESQKELLLTVIDWASDEMDMDELDSINELEKLALKIKGLRTIEKSE